VLQVAGLQGERYEKFSNSLHMSLSYRQQKTGTDRENVSENISENVSEKLSPNQQKMINAIKGNKKITYKIDPTITCYIVLLYFLY
jgi:hypothetical protein